MPGLGSVTLERYGLFGGRDSRPQTQSVGNSFRHWRGWGGGVQREGIKFLFSSPASVKDS